MMARWLFGSMACLVVAIGALSSGGIVCLNIHRVRSELAEFEVALEKHRGLRGEYPRSVLTELEGVALRRVPKDAWAQPYAYWYVPMMRSPFVYSIGVDGIDSF